MILLTGANGLIGSAIARRYIQAGVPVRALKRANANVSLLQDLEGQIDWVEGDVLNSSSLSDAINGVTAVIHTAAVVSFAPKDRAAMYKINVEGTANVVNVCLDAGIQKLGFVSSVAALGRPSAHEFASDQPIYIDETQKWEESPLNSEYAKTKYLAELEVWRGVAEGLNAVIVCPSVVLGEGDWNRSSSQLFKYVWQERPFYSKGSLNYVDVIDVAEAVFQLMNSSISDERFVLSAGTTTYQELFNKIATSFGKKPPPYAISPLLAAIAWRFEAVRSWLTGKAPLVTKETARTSFNHFVYRSNKLIDATNFNFTNLDDTIKRVSTFFANKVQNP